MKPNQTGPPQAIRIYGPERATSRARSCSTRSSNDQEHRLSKPEVEGKRPVCQLRAQRAGFKTDSPTMSVLPGAA